MMKRFILISILVASQLVFSCAWGTATPKRESMQALTDNFVKSYAQQLSLSDIAKEELQAFIGTLTPIEKYFLLTVADTTQFGEGGEIEPESFEGAGIEMTEEMKREANEELAQLILKEREEMTMLLNVEKLAILANRKNLTSPSFLATHNLRNTPLLGTEASSDDFLQCNDNYMGLQTMGGSCFEQVRYWTLPNSEVLIAHCALLVNSSPHGNIDSNAFWIFYKDNGQTITPVNVKIDCTMDDFFDQAAMQKDNVEIGANDAIEIRLLPTSQDIATYVNNPTNDLSSYYKFEEEFLYLKWNGDGTFIKLEPSSPASF